MDEKQASGKITEARITAMPRPMPAGMFDAMPKVIVRVDGGQEVELFDYYPDELSFAPSEFIGLTLAEGRQLKVAKDIAYLRN